MHLSEPKNSKFLLFIFVDLFIIASKAFKRQAVHERVMRGGLVTEPRRVRVFYLPGQNIYT